MTSAVRQLPKNVAGRDFAMGDLHGEVNALSERLAELKFDPEKDRLFSVGDLIDRGSDSLAALHLLDKPWFFAVQGNHERMMYDYLFEQGPLDWILEDGAWWQQLAEDDIEDARRLARQTRLLPLVLRVGDGDRCFQVVHAELPLADRYLDREWTSREIEVATWSRTLSKEVCDFQSCESLTVPHALPIANHEIEQSPHYKPIDRDWRLTFCGHCVVERPMLWRSHYLLDTGSGWKGGRLTVINVADALAQFRYFGAIYG